MNAMGDSMRRAVTALICWTALCVPALLHPSLAWGDDFVTYEVVSNDVGIANVEYETTDGRMSTQGVTLPWRIDAVVHTVRGAPPDGSQVRADWRPSAAPARWVSVRIIYQGKVICQNTLDLGNAACYGITPRIT